MRAIVTTSTTKRIALVALFAAFTLWSAVHPAASRAALGFSPGQFSVQLTDDQGNPSTQAGAHPNLTTSFFTDTKDGGGGTLLLQESIRSVHVDLPAGYLGDPTGTPTCTQDQLTGGGNLLPPSCPPASQIGEATLYTAPCSTLRGCPIIAGAPVYNMVHPTDTPAALGLNIMVTGVTMEARVLDDGQTIRVSMNNIPQSYTLLGFEMTLWGVPHDHNGPPISYDPVTWAPVYDQPGNGPRTSYIRSATSCEGNAVAHITGTSWQSPGAAPATDSVTIPARTGCDSVPFAPTAKATPASTQAGAPTAYDVNVHVPQTDDPDAPSTADLRKAVVKLPEGVSLSPAVAGGLQACTDEQLGVGKSVDPSCPDASKIGTVRIDTPLLDVPLTGGVYVGEQKSSDPASGDMFRIFLTASAQGVRIKLPGKISVDPTTGQLTTTFDDNPQLPFSDLTLSFKGGDRAPLVNPSTCGTHTTHADFTSWAGTTASSDDSFETTGCSSQFAPTFDAGTTDAKAGGFAPFTMTVRRTDADEELAGISLQLPSGLLGILPGIPQCDEMAAAAGTCPEATRVGTTTVSSGAGDQPFSLTGKVYLAGAYKGAPYSLVVAVPAVAGPYDLGMVTVRVPLKIDASSASVGAPADPLPTILKGVPLRLKMINITLDRPGFMFNATDCTRRAVTATLTSVTGKTAAVSTPYQPSGCANLPLDPQLKLGLNGSAKDLRRNGHPTLTADLTQGKGQAGLKTVQVTLPQGISVDLKNLGNVCTAADAAARKCADSSIVGKASAVTPALPAALSGPIYFVENKQTDPKTGKTIAGLPRLWLKLEGGGVPLDLWADSSFSKTNRIITTFNTIPDAPISSFELQINGGPKGILIAGTDVCSSTREVDAVFDGQNGKRVGRTFKAGDGCRLRVAKTSVVQTHVELTLSGVRPGTVSGSGKGVRFKRRKVVSDDVVTLSIPLSAAAKRAIAQDGKVRVRITVVHTDASGKKTRLHKSLTVRRAQVLAPPPFRPVG